MMDRTEIIGLAREAGFRVFGETVVAADKGSSGLATDSIERFAELVAAQYRRDAERYRKLIALLQEACDGNAIELENSFIVDCSMVSGYKTERRVQAVLGWADTRDEPLNLDAAIDKAMEKVK